MERTRGAGALGAVLCVLVACGGGTSPDGGADLGTSGDLGVPDLVADLGPDLADCPDEDSDGHRAATCGGDDCDDADALRYPGATEFCDAAGRDEDCDPSTLGPDADGDGESANGCCDTQPGGALSCGRDCDDTRATIGPSAVEACNGSDDNCNGVTDEGVPMQTCFADADSDGYAATGATSRTSCSCMAGVETTRAPIGTDVDCEDHNAAMHPGGTEVCDGLDNDCNGLPDDGVGDLYYADCDRDGFATDAGPMVTSCSVPTTHPSTCAATGGWAMTTGDCNDGVASTHPGAADACNGVDDDCDGDTDDTGCTCVAGAMIPCGEPDGTGGYSMVGICRPGTQTCSGGTWGACIGATLARSETCNSMDDDCNGVTDDGVGSAYFVDCDADTYGRDAGNILACSLPVTPPAVCGATPGARWATTGGDCDDTRAAAHPLGAETCNALDDECNAVIDDAAPTAAWCVDPTRTPHSTGAACLAGTCVPTGCASGYVDCTTAPGCETVPATDASHCGTCSTVCHGWGAGSSATCTGGICQYDVTLASHHNHTCAWRGIGTAVCWGRNQYGQIGDGTTTDRGAPTAVMTLTDVTQMATGEEHTCALRATGAVACFGHGGVGELGDGLATHPSCGTQCQTTPATTVSGLTDAVEITAGSQHACARRATGAVVCWGDNSYGVLGDGTTTNRSVPATVTGLTDAVEVSGGAAHTCARHASGAVACWGSNNAGQLGTGGGLASRKTPVEVVGLTDAVELASGGAGFTVDSTCARRATGEVVCWGDINGSRTPAAVSGITNAVEITFGERHACARLATGTVMCWGDNGSGRLGDGTTTDRSVPVAVSGLTDAVGIAAGGAHTCARRATGAVQCWGENSDHQLGNGVTADSHVPTDVTPP